MKTKALGRIVVGATLAFVWHTSIAAGAAELGRDANASLQKLYASVPAAKALGAKAQAILVFPKVTKAGLGVGGQFGEGALLKRARRSRTTTPLARRSACRLAPSNSATRCSS